MNGQQLIEALRSGRQVYGTLIVSPSPFWPARVKQLGLDLVFIDTEHIPLDRSMVAWMCQTYTALELAPVVRIPSPDPFQAQMVLDGGAAGVIVPYIESAEQVLTLAGAIKWGPLKGQKLRGILDQQAEAEPELADYLAERAARKAFIVNIESVPAVQALDDILSGPYVDAVLIGPHDLSCSLGIPEQYDHPDFDAAVRTIIRTARAHGVGVGIHIDSIEQEIAWSQAGANLIMHSSDIVSFLNRLTEDFGRIRSGLHDERKTSAEQVNI
ncbi:MAG: aldolase [Anaerolineaceae bacterium]|nr:aldolase [Anaerolineaceae bacterium]